MGPGHGLLKAELPGEAGLLRQQVASEDRHRLAMGWQGCKQLHL
jgi:hypothetical protein